MDAGSTEGAGSTIPMNVSSVIVAAMLSGGVSLHATDPKPVAVNLERERKPAAEQVRVITTAELRSEIQSHKGRPLILHFWATWCVPCLTELPFLARTAQDLRRKGVDFLPISLDSPTPKSAQHVGTLLAQRVQDPQWSPILRVADVDAFMNSIDPDWEGAIPIFFAFDSDTRLRRTHLGNINQSEVTALVAEVMAVQKKK